MKDHLRNAAVTSIIIAINKKRNEGHHIVLTIDGNETFINSSGGIARICRECKLFYPLDNKHRNTCDLKSFLGGSNKIDLLLRSMAICIQYFFAVRLLIPTENGTRLASEIVIPYVLVLGVYLEMDAFIASFCCVLKGWKYSLNRPRVVNGLNTFHTCSYSLASFILLR